MATYADHPIDQYIHHLIEAQVAHAPNTIAVVCDDHHLTYHELNQWSNHIAYQVRKRGVRPDVRVGITVISEMEMVVGTLAILKAGGTCVPLDLSLPHDQQAFVIEDAQLSLLLTQKQLLQTMHRSPLHNMAHIIYVDRESNAAGQTDNPVSGVSGDALAYIIYTPNGADTLQPIALTHRTILHLVHANQKANLFNYPEKQTRDSLSWSTIVEDVLLPLAHGIPLVMTKYPQCDQISYIQCNTG